MALHHGRHIRLWCCTISTIRKGKVLELNMDTATIYEVGQDDIPNIVCPVMATNAKSRELAFEWGHTLVRLSGKPVTIYRNGALMITLSAQH